VNCGSIFFFLLKYVLFVLCSLQIVDGQFTFVSHQGNKVIDYVLVSIDFIYKTWMHFEIGSRVESRHMPLHLSIAKKQTQEEEKTETELNERKYNKN